ncbi:coiled-coil domain-containing protein [Methylosinus sp. LW4]|uniref:coiled-coil domain-containing protein n=1 Tax=Methylosinus sp. LW4 TaxID=136993 RepID=UPI00037C2ACE|nr:coiled-coil domain-containing protein [Methylosinus sp. LW4]
MSVAFDTLKFVEKLEAGGFTHEQAKAAAEAFAEATSQELATKTDILAVRSEIRELELPMTVKLGGLTVVATGIILAAIRYLPGAH